MRTTDLGELRTAAGSYHGAPTFGSPVGCWICICTSVYSLSKCCFVVYCLPSDFPWLSRDPNPGLLRLDPTLCPHCTTLVRLHAVFCVYVSVHRHTGDSKTNEKMLTSNAMMFQLLHSSAHQGRLYLNVASLEYSRWSALL